MCDHSQRKLAKRAGVFPKGEQDPAVLVGDAIIVVVKLQCALKGWQSCVRSLEVIKGPTGVEPSVRQIRKSFGGFPKPCQGLDNITGSSQSAAIIDINSWKPPTVFQYWFNDTLSF